MNAVSEHAAAVRAELTATPAVGTPMGPTLRRKREAFLQLEEAERTGNIGLGFRAIRELLELLLGRG